MTWFEDGLRAALDAREIKKTIAEFPVKSGAVRAALINGLICPDCGSNVGCKCDGEDNKNADRNKS